MAYYERGDEANKLIVCNICNVKVKESGLTVHKAKCCEKPDHKKRFSEGGDLQKCQYDSSHIIKGLNMDIHLEFCTKYQDIMAAEHQTAWRQAQKILEAHSPDKGGPKQEPESQPDDGWHRAANSEPFLSDLSRLKI